MSSLVLPHRFYNQPQGAVQVRPEFAVGMNAAGYASSAGPIDALSGYVFSKTGAAGVGLKPEGISATTGTGSTDVWSASIRQNNLANTNEVTIFALAYSDVSNSTRKRVVRFSNTALGTIVNIDFGDGTSNCYAAGAQVPPSAFLASNFTTTVPTVSPIAVSWSRKGTQHSLMTNGIEVGTSGLTSTSNHSGSPDAIYIGNSGSGFPLNGGVLMWALWEYQLSKSVLTDLAANPWQIFKVSE
jgi:hypothetical protein